MLQLCDGAGELVQLWSCIREVDSSREAGAPHQWLQGDGGQEGRPIPLEPCSKPCQGMLAVCLLLGFDLTLDVFDLTLDNQ